VNPTLSERLRRQAHGRFPALPFRVPTDPPAALGAVEDLWDVRVAHGCLPAQPPPVAPSAVPAAAAVPAVPTVPVDTAVPDGPAVRCVEPMAEVLELVLWLVVVVIEGLQALPRLTRSSRAGA